jgi:cell division protein DivIC
MGFDWFMVVLLIVFAVFSYTLFEQQVHLTTIDRDYAAAQERLDMAQQENGSLHQEKHDLNDPAYIEKVAREDLGMTRPGEMPYIPAKRD